MKDEGLVIKFFGDFWEAFGERNWVNVYFQERWEDAADTIVNFDEDYFENMDRINLYVFLSALYDNEAHDYLQSA